MDERRERMSTYANARSLAVCSIALITASLGLACYDKPSRGEVRTVQVERRAPAAQAAHENAEERERRSASAAPLVANGPVTLTVGERRQLAESKGWTCNETTCSITTNIQQLPDAVFEAVPAAAKELPQANPSGVGVVTSALQTAETTVLNVAGTSVSEPAATYFRSDVGSIVSMNVFTNISSNQLLHACSRDYLSWCMYQHNVSANPNGGDPAPAFEDVGTNFLHVAMLDNAGTNFRWYHRTGNPCPSPCGGAQTWTQCNIPLPYAPGGDYPWFVYDRINDRRWLLFNAGSFFDPAYSSIMIAEVPQPSDGTCPAIATYHIPNCTWTGDQRFVRGTMDSGGDLHLVFLDSQPNPDEYVHTRFDTNTRTWQCDRHVMSTFVRPAGSCGACAAGYQGIGNCLRSTFNPSIAIDDTSTPNTLITAISTNDGTREARLRIFRSTNDGANWNMVNQSDGNTYQPYAVFTRTPFSAVADRFHIISLWDVDSAVNSSNVRTLSWRSTNDGQSFTPTLISNSRSVAQNGACYWGDYHAIAADRSSTGVFYGYTDHSVSPWRIRGRLINE
ncbi:MAG TPA: hypothetical protein VJR89_13810 [Polyangiales bacterium]|nr:hypothetical protein [Polyangiales bacterium]